MEELGQARVSTRQIQNTGGNGSRGFGAVKRDTKKHDLEDMAWRRELVREYQIGTGMKIGRFLGFERNTGDIALGHRRKEGVRVVEKGVYEVRELRIVREFWGVWLQGSHGKKVEATAYVDFLHATSLWPVKHFERSRSELWQRSSEG
jgi:hypothetical protein